MNRRLTAALAVWAALFVALVAVSVGLDYPLMPGADNPMFFLVLSVLLFLNQLRDREHYKAAVPYTRAALALSIATSCVLWLGSDATQLVKMVVVSLALSGVLAFVVTNIYADTVSRDEQNEPEPDTSSLHCVVLNQLERMLEQYVPESSHQNHKHRAHATDLFYAAFHLIEVLRLAEFDPEERAEVHRRFAALQSQYADVHDLDELLDGAHFKRKGMRWDLPVPKPAAATT